MVRIRRPSKALDLMAFRAIQETEAFLAECLEHPERAVRIPRVRFGAGTFPPGLAAAFWKEVLDLGD
jgi:hypothetical protein